MADAKATPSKTRPVRSRTFAAIDHPGFRRYYVGQGISLIGTWLQSAAVCWLVYDQTHSEFMLGIIEVASLMPGLLVGLFAGALADRMAPRTMLVVMEFGQMGLAFALATLVGLQVVQIWQMAAILALARICVTFELPSRQVFFYELVGPEILPNAIAHQFRSLQCHPSPRARGRGRLLVHAGCDRMLRAEWSELSGGDCRHFVDPTSQATSPYAYRGL